MNDPIEFIMIGGFLGAGKTTLIVNLAKRLQAEGKHVCVVTNDQAAGLVDTELLKSQGLEINEVAGSCFCCNFDGLTDAMDEFETRRRPDVILAEPVGSCTDLIETIALPMMERLGGKFTQSRVESPKRSFKRSSVWMSKSGQTSTSPPERMIRCTSTSSGEGRLSTHRSTSISLNPGAPGSELL